MGAQDGTSSDHLSFLREAAGSIRRFSFFGLLRQAEARAPGKPRIGRSRLPRQNIVDLAHATSMDFPGPTIASIDLARANGRPLVHSLFLGLTGPMGAMPLHVSEFVAYERRYAPKQPFGRFLDLLTDRMLQFFYRAWADTQPAVHADRGDDNRFAGYVAALAGAKQDENSHFPFGARLYFAGLLGSRRSPAVLADCLGVLLGTKAAIREFLPQWRDIAVEERTRLGRGFNRLGGDAVLGRRVRVIDDAFRVSVRARDMADYRRYLPGGPVFPVIRDVLNVLAPPQLEWQLQLGIDAQAVEGTRLDARARLGWSTWIGSGRGSGVREDARLGRWASVTDKGA